MLPFAHKHDLFDVPDSRLERDSRYKDAILRDNKADMQAMAPASLPSPDAQSAAHSDRCAEFIRQKIRNSGGSISFAEYMHHALYAPELGYYTAGNTKFGAAGDFITAPEVSPFFGRILARQCAVTLADMGQASLLELGAGSGRLAVDLLKKLDDLGALPKQYLILEVSADLQQRQAAFMREEIPMLFDRVSWVSELPKAHRGVVIANEVLDALPVERIVRRAEIQQQRVVINGNLFSIVEYTAPERLVAAVNEIEEDLGQALPEDYMSDVSLAGPRLVRDIVAALEAGVVFLFDYGVSRREYYSAERSGGWLRCHFRHHAHNDPLILPGIQDLTAWIDFTAIANAATQAGADVAAYVSQAIFMMSGGLEQELADIASLPQKQQIELSAQVKMLTLPGQMGEHFKCLALRKGSAKSPSAFQFADRTHTL